MSSNNKNNGFGQVSGQTESEIKKYLRILQKRKWIIISTSIVFFWFWMAFVIVFQGKPTYTSTVLLTFQDPRSMSAVGVVERRPVNVGKASLIKTNLLLGQVVESLQLNLSMVTDNVHRQELFDTVRVNRSSVPGTYKIVPDSEGYRLMYTDKRRDISDSLLIRFRPGDTVAVHNFMFVLRPEVFRHKKLKEVEFRINDFKLAIEWLRRTVEYKLDRYQTILYITARHKDPNMAAKIVNTLAELFVQLNLKMKRFKSDEVLRILEDQLQLARKDLDKANDRLKRFRERYPWVVLTADAGMRVSSVASLEDNMNSLDLKIGDLQGLIRRMRQAANMDEKISAARELLTFLETEGVPTATAFRSEFGDLYLKRNELLGQYAISHPFVKENEQQFQNLFLKIEAAAKDRISKLEGRKQQIQSKVASERAKLRKLPSKELELAELLRDQEVKNDLYRRILARYNAAKIENEVEVSDVFIVDYGTPPPPQGVLAVIIKKGLVGIFIALGLGFGLALVIEFFDKTVQNADELQTRVKYPVLGSIPVIKDDKELPDDFEELKGKRDPKLITLDYSPTLESESYRDLRTKILYMNQNQDFSSFIVTSLRPNEGKSLTAANLAITIAQQKISTLLIDADLRRGVLHNVFGNKKKPGLSDFLISNATVDYENLSKLIQNTFIPNLYLITAGSPIPNPTEMLGSERMAMLLSVLRKKFGMIILDTAPFQASSDGAILANYVDAVLIVIRAGTTNVDHLVQKVEEYPNLQRKVMGLILNAVKVDLKKNQYQYSYYNY